MKILGLNFGRAKGNCKWFLEKAIEAAKAAAPDAEIEIIDTINRKIGRCMGCGATTDHWVSMGIAGMQLF